MYERAHHHTAFRDPPVAHWFKMPNVEETIDLYALGVLGSLTVLKSYKLGMSIRGEC